jgi:hypothetical protein
MDYAKAYERLIGRARGRILGGYSESHHVLPKCMGGGDEPENLVDLTAEEHFVAHQLLVKMHPENGRLAFALIALCMDRDGVRLNNKLFGWMRRRASKARSEATLGKARPAWIMEKMRIANKGRPLTPEHRAKVSAALRGKPKSREHVAKVSAALKGRHDIGMFGRKHSPETRAKMRAKALGRKHTAETKTKFAASYAQQTPEQRSARAHKAWKTKRRKQAVEEKPITV